MDFKDDSILKVNIKTPKNNNININLVSNPKKPDLQVNIKE